MSTSQETILVQKRMLRMHTKLLSTILVLWITLMMNIEHIQSFINMCTDTFFLYGHYGNRGCGIFKGGIQN